MFRRSLIVWELSAVFIAIILVVFVILGYANNLVDEHYALASASHLCRLNSATIQQSIKKPLMTRDNESVKELFDNLAKNDPVYREMRLVSHNGEVVASRYDTKGERLPLESRSCQVCHRHDNPLDGTAVTNHDEIVELPNGTRIVSVIAPLLNEATCSTADCHVHADGPPVLGFLQTDYSLSDVDALTSARNTQTAIAALIAIALGTVGTFLMVGRLLEGPMRILIEGMKRIGLGDLSFRLNVRRKDEFATVAESFNDMTSRLDSSLSELRETGDYLEGIVENEADIIITVNPSGLIQTFNSGAEAALGFDRGEVIGRRIETLFANPQERDVAIERLAHSDTVANFETRFLAKNGTVRDVLLTLSRLRRPDGTPIGTVGISKDLTTEKKLQQQLIQSERFAAAGQSFTALQHAMKNMLFMLKGASYMVKTGIKKDDHEMLADGWEMVEGGISSLTELSKDMLKYMKNWEPEFKWVSVGEIIEKIDGLIAKTASDKGVTFNTLVLPELPEVYCDAGLIHSAVMDIVSNALEACRSKDYEEGELPQIDLATTHFEASGKLVIEISDNGPGMAEGVKANIFTPFFSTKRDKGTGLGLALTSRFVNLHGGAIEVVSEPGAGATFRILLPVAGPDKNKENRYGKESAGHR
ncbi:MAG: ATP-binding protein [Planctomycetota bacterium]|jgi:PAS domain S-box-containing protein